MRWSRPRPRPGPPRLLLAVLTLAVVALGEHVRDLEVSEGAPVGTRVGLIGDGEGGGTPPYLIVPVPGSPVDSDLAIDQSTGEIRTRVRLDRETRASYSLVAIPTSGENVRVVVRVRDENDNAPTFPTPVMNIEFPENTPRDVKRTLQPARDPDLGAFSTQRYSIVSGNVNNAFKLSSHEERDGVLYLDLQIHGILDRETTAFYSLLIEAVDGGSPPLRGTMTVNITILDVNDNQPLFNQSRYFATIPENATVGTGVLQVFATDADAGDNGQVEYSINRRQSDRAAMFKIDPATGQISVNRPLDFETKQVHELVVVAKDHGLQPLETTAFVSISVTDVNDNQPTINLIFLSDDATPKISEAAQPGEFVARISVHDPDSKSEYSPGEHVNVTLEGGDGCFGLANRDNIIYLVIVSLPLDREARPNYTLSVVATDGGSPPLHASRTFHLRVTDVNDNPPEFTQSQYTASVMEVAEPGTSVARVRATDRDEGVNAEVTYSLVDTPESHSGWFQVDAGTGVVSLRAHVDCETDPQPRLVVVASDRGQPPLSATATVLVTVHDVNDNEPIFDQSFYNVTVAENEAPGCSILKVSATDPDCGVNAMVNYTLGEDFGKMKEFSVRPSTGEICIAGDLDYETRNVFEFAVLATDRGGLSTTAMVKIQLTDVNDNAPVFLPREYNVSLRPNTPPNTPVVVVVATDRDSGRYAEVTYAIAAGNEAGAFRIDAKSGELFVSRADLLQAATHRLNVSATDGGGLRSPVDAQVSLTVVASDQRPPLFERPRYTYSVRENVPRLSAVGAVRAASGDAGGVRYSLYPGDPDGYFSIDPVSGGIRTAAALDHETHQSVLLNVQATSGDPPAYGHTQVNINIEDVNDNAPEFDSATVRLSVPENAGVGVALYAALARDRDSGRNGEVSYRLGPVSDGPGASSGSSSAGRPLFVVHPRTGHLTLTRPLDYEAAQRHTLVLTATDAGEPPLSSNLTVLVEVQDVNDNPPVFERPSYAVSMPEGQPVNAQVVQVTAVDLDTGNNARLTYRLQLDDDEYPDSLPLSVAPTTGWLSLRAPLDREVRDRYQVAVVARDSGTPPLSATTTVTLTVLDDNDNDPAFGRDRYDFAVEENAARGTVLGVVTATDRDLGPNAAIRYALLGVVNNSFTINPVTGEVTTRGPLDREARGEYELVAEAKDGGSPARSARVPVRVTVLDVNDNAPELVDPQDDVLSVREEQPPGTEVGHLRAVDRDLGANASVTFSIVRDRDSESAGLFTVDPVTGVIRTRAVLNHEDRAIYRLQVAATDAGTPPRQTVRVLRIEVLDVNDNRSTFTSSSLVFQVREDAPIGYQIGTVAGGGSLSALGDVDTSPRHVTYTLTSLSPAVEAAADQDGGMSPASLEVARGSGALVVAGRLDRERVAEYRLEVRAQDTGLGTASHPQSAAVSVRVEVLDVNDNAPAWPADPVNLSVREDAALGTALWNLTAADPDQGVNGELRYSLLRTWPALGPPFDTPPFAVDPLTGTVSLAAPLDHETIHEYTLVLRATDQAANASERLSATMTARVRVEDANDNAPEFVSPATVSVRYAERAGAVLSHVVAVDRDRGDNGRVTYVIAAGNEDGRLALGYDTGLLSLARPLPRPLGPGETASLTLNVTASDHGKPLAKHASVRLTVVLRGATDAPPRFTRPLYAANISEDAHPGSFVARVSARPAGTAAAAGADSSTSAGNLTYHIPAGAADDRFAVDPVRGVVTTRAPLDRELRDHYKVPILAVDSAAPDLYDEAVLEVTLTDVNDHAPSFPPGSCYTVRVPENAEEAVIHSLAAEDADLGANGEVTYTITAGNVGNKLRLDPNTGELTAKSLDRESVSQYWLVVTARDRGSPKALQGSCNISVVVLDQNDNDPQFAQPRYAAQVAEGVPVGHVVVTVRGRDADAGENARLTYTLANETHWLFAIDNETGVITTAGPLDRERQSEYRLEVVATDGGRYSARSQSVPVHITVTDVNDEAPVFSRFPFTASVAATAQPGQSVIRVSAQDADQGVNGEVLYSLEHGHHDRFRLDPSTGVVSVASALTAEAGRLFRLTVLARDKGNPPLSSTGMVEVRVTGASSLSDEEAASLRFQNASYAVQLEEHAAAGTAVAQVQAVRSDGRLQRISYRLLGPGGAAGAGPQDAFDIHPTTGLVRVRDPARLDYERAPTVSLVVRAEAEGATAAMPGLTGYTELVVRLSDVNDNEPRFTQRVYQAAVWEGRSKGTAVLRVAAVDADQGGDSQGVTGGLLYHIVDGNHDNAFVISPATSGLVKTNIVLDREIRDSYRLTVIATDQGQGSSGRQLTGTATIRISVVDVNDNRPTFPPHSVVSVSEARALGTPITAVTANDVDTYPALTYSFASAAPSDPNDPPALSQSEGPFAIDRFSGTVTLTRHLDYEARREHQLRVVASDSAYTAVTELTVKVQDDNDNAPVFTRDEYEARLTGAAEAGQALLTVNATDADSGLNGEVRYALRRRDGQPSAAFYVDELTGALYANRSEDAAGLPRADADDVELVVVATDRGEPPLSATASVRVRVGDAGGITPKFTQDEYRVHIREDAPLGSTVVKIGVFSAFTADSGRDVEYAIVDGNLADTFRVLSPSGDVVVVRPLDREAVDLYSLRLAAGGRPGNASASSPSSSSILVHVTVDDANDHAPAFATPSYEAAVSEGAAVGTAVLTVAAVDADQAGGPNADVAYDILSGNDADLFAMDAASGVLSVKRPLDFDSGPTRFALVVRAADSARFPPDAPLASLAAVTVTLLDENDNAPQFPVSEYLELVPENEPAGTAVFTARAVDLDRGPFGALNYTIVSSGDADDSWRLFRVDAGSGLVTTNGVYDYEARNRYAFTLRATDAGGRSAHVRVRVEVESRDEFHPQFTERTYRLALPPGLGRGPLPAGTVLGSVTATDRDKGLDGRVVYQLNTQHPHLKVNRTTGAIVVKKKLDVAELYAGQDVSLVVTASSGRPGSLTNMTVVELSVDAAHAHGATEHNLASSALDAGMAGGAAAAGLADWALGLLIALILVVLAFGAVFLFLHVRNRRHKKVNKPGLGAHAHPHAGLGQLPHPGQHLGQHPHGLGHGMAGCGASTVASDTYVDPSAFDTIPMPRPPCHTSASLTGPFAPPKYDEIPPYRSSKAAKAAAAAKGGSPSSPGRGPTSELSGSEQSGSSGRGSAEDGEEEDEEIRMINEQRGHRRAEDAISDVSVHNTQQYLARLGIVDTNNHPASVSASASLHASTQASTRTSCSEPLDAMGHGLGLGHGALDETDVAAEADITNLIYAKLNDVGSEMSERGSERGSSVAGVAVGGTHVQPSMTGSLSSIVHSEEELTGSYNWDYLLDWGPQYQPLAHVFSEIARLKDDTDTDCASVQSGQSHKGSGSQKSGMLPVPMPPMPPMPQGPHPVPGPRTAPGPGGKTMQLPLPPLPPPLLTAVAPRTIPPIAPMSARGPPPSMAQLLLMPRSPISHDVAMTGGFSTSTAMSPSFSPSLSPLATRSPSLSPLSPPSHHVVSLPRTVTDTELRI